MSAASIMSEEMDDQISEYCHKPVVNDSVSVQEVLDDIKCEVRELSKSIAATTKPNNSRKISLNPDNTLIPTERNVLLKQKTQIVNTLRVEMEMDKYHEVPSTASEIFNTYLSEITKDVQKIDECINIETKREKNIESKVERLKKCEESLRSLEEGFEDRQESISAEKEMLITQDFKMIKAELTQFLSLISPDGKLKEILERLMTQSSAEGDEKYLDITDENLTYINLLLSANIVCKHPVRPGKVCFENFD